MAPPAKRTDGEFWANWGPLGLLNFRRQLGRSDELGDPLPVNKTRAILVETGATSKGKKRAEGDAAASMLTISCSYDGNNDANTQRPLQIRGLVEWGTDGHQLGARFDWLHGTAIHVAGSFVRVIAEIEDNATALEVSEGQLVLTHNTQAIARVGAVVAYGSHGGRAPTFTAQIALLAGAPLVIGIPTFANALTIYGPALTDAQWALAPSPAGAFAPVATPPAVPSSAIVYPRPGPATHLVLTSPADSMQTLVWGLAL